MSAETARESRDMEAVSGSGMDAAGGIAMRTAAIQRTAGK